jgi:protein-S-isoprenylcysteine O-methyltransferase Ste14
MVPPQRLVVIGQYRYVRNPMYLGFFAGWAGLWVIFGPGECGRYRVGVCCAGGRGSVCGAVRAAPTLRKKFGADYEEYCRNVRAWIPRMRRWVS